MPRAWLHLLILVGVGLGFEPLREGGRVVMDAREGYFGTLAFSIRPAY